MADATPSLWQYSSPEALQIARQSAMQQAAAEFAKKTQQQRTDEAGYMAGASLRGGLNSLFGVEDQGLQQVKQFQEIMRDVDRQDHNSIFAAAKKLQDINHPAFDYVVKVGEKVKKDQAELAKTAAETENQKAQAGRATADAAEKYNSMLTATEKKANRIKALKELGIPENQIEGIASDDKTFESYLKRAGTTITEADGQVLMVDDRTGKVIKTLGKAPERGTRVNVDARTVGESEFVKQLAGLDAKKVSEAFDIRRTSIQGLNALTELEKLDNNGLISGTFASGRVGAANLLNTIGLLSKSDADKLSRSENYQKVAGDVVLQTLGGKLGAGFSNEDRKFIQSLVPQLENSAQARRQLIQFMKKKNADIIEETIRMEEYARAKNGLGGYTPKLELSTQAGNPSLSQYSTEELKAMLEKAKMAEKDKTPKK